MIKLNLCLREFLNADEQALMGLGSGGEGGRLYL